MAPALEPEDQKLVVLAKATRARTGAPQGAALRDLDGRTYAGATVDLPSLRVSAVGVVVAMALSSGSRGAEALVVLGDPDTADAGDAGDGAAGTDDLSVLRDFAGPGVPVHRGSPAGAVREVTST
ncbi:MAG: cytidine deaminase [Marmoricola sp.]|nr:cytidine deaminase [Marmoricola sp.]